jgi:hypothetical protein
MRTKESEQLTDLEATAEQRVRATRAVAATAVDAADCRLLLDILGLSAREAQPPVPPQRTG